MKDDEAERRAANTAFERHTQTALVILVVALLSWVGLTVNANQVQLAKLTVTVENLHDQISTPSARVNDLTRRIEIIEETVLKSAEKARE